MKDGLPTKWTRRDILMALGVGGAVVGTGGLILHEAFRPKEFEIYGSKEGDPIGSSHFLVQTRMDEGKIQGEDKILLLNAKGEFMRDFTGNSSSWSPDGTTFVYQRLSYDSQGKVSMGEFFWVNVTNGVETPLSFPPKRTKADVGDPALLYSDTQIYWHPDSSMIFYNDYSYQKRGIWGVRLSDQHAFPVVQTLESKQNMDSEPIVSPDGKKLLFTHRQDNYVPYFSVADFDPDKFPYQGENLPYEQLQRTNPAFRTILPQSAGENQVLGWHVIGWTSDSKKIIYQAVPNGRTIGYETFVTDVASGDTITYSTPHSLYANNVSHDRHKAAWIGGKAITILDLSSGSMQTFSFGGKETPPPGLRRIDKKAGVKGAPEVQWSAHDKEIVFTLGNDETIFSIKPDGTQLRPVVNTSYGLSNPYFSLDKVRISPQ